MKKLKLWWKFEGQYIPWNIKNGIKNLIFWFKIIWKDRNYNSNYIYIILAHKISSIRNITLKTKRFVNWQQQVNKLNLVLSLIEKVKDAYYEFEPYEYQKNKTEYIPVEDSDYCKNCVEIKQILLSENLIDYFIKHRNAYRKVTKNYNFRQLTDKQDIARKISKLKAEQAKRILWSLINKNIDKW